MKKIILFIVLIFIIAVMVNTAGKMDKRETIDFKGKTVILKSENGLNLKADLYEIADKEAPVIILFHQARFSRGEYRETAPKLNALGFNCIAIDQRSGKEVNGVKNEAFQEAVGKGMGTKYTDAFPDLEAALKFVLKKYSSKKIIVWGSSYSASLVFVLAQKYPEKISAVIAFSPGEYFKFEDKTIREYAKKVTCPVFFTSAKREHKNWKNIFESIPGNKKFSFLPETKGVHGSRALWKANESNKSYWNALKKFLVKIKK